jgi:hypothetical protein
MGLRNVYHSPTALLPGSFPVQEAGLAPGPVLTGVEIFVPARIRSADRPARSRWLYRLSYPGSQTSHFHGSTALPALGFLIVDVSRSHSDTPHSPRLLWTGDHSNAETSTWQHTKFTTHRHPSPGGIRIRNPRKPAAADPSLRPRGHRDGQLRTLFVYIQLTVLSNGVFI